MLHETCPRGGGSVAPKLISDKWWIFLPNFENDAVEPELAAICECRAAISFPLHGIETPGSTIYMYHWSQE